MKQEIINKLSEVLPQNYWTETDFYHDIKRLNKMSDDEQFLWVACTRGTSLSALDRELSESAVDDESERFTLYRDPLCGFPFTVDYAKEDGAVIMHYDGHNLSTMTYTEMRQMLENKVNHLVNLAKMRYPNESLLAHMELPICYASEDTQLAVFEALARCKGCNDNSLAECLQRLRNCQRTATNHYIWVGADLYDNCFTFREVCNGETIINGGIIYIEEPSDGCHYQIHT